MSWLPKIINLGYRDHSMASKQNFLNPESKTIICSCNNPKLRLRAYFLTITCSDIKRLLKSFENLELTIRILILPLFNNNTY